MIIRELRADEYHLLKEFTYHAIFIRDGEPPAPLTVLDDPHIKVFYENFGKSDDNAIAAFINGEPVGAVWTRIIDGEVKGFGNIDSTTPEFGISLLKEYRGLGIGTKLMQAMLELLRQKGYKRTSLAVQKDNYAVKMYQNVGLVIIEELDEEYLMVCEL